MLFEDFEIKLIEVINNSSRIEIKKEELIKEIKRENLNLIDDLGFDSFSMIQLIINIESEFNIEISMEELELEKLINYKGLCEYIFPMVSE